MGRIIKLDAGVVSLIAAGEVVEGPWSVVKELVENSLDAGAVRVDVGLNGGGFDEIKVADDGCGMDGADVALAFERYATSKLAAARDLDAIRTMGFRGEALAAIAAVARVTLYTRCREEALGWKAQAADGRVAVAPEGTAAGTTVVVRELFYNVPARRKFAGRPAAEWRRAAEAFRRLALAQLAPAFSLSKDGRLMYTAGADASPRQRLGEILGWEYVEGLIAVEEAAGPYELRAYLVPPPSSFVGTSNIFTIINGRPARAKPLFKAVAGAYDGRLERGRYPMAVVYLTLPPDAVDVNVHPRKEEVRLADENAVYEFVSGALRRALAGVVVAVPASSFAPSPAASTGAPAPEKADGPADAATREAVAGVRDAVEGYLKSRSLWPERRGEGAAPFTEAGGAPLVAGPGKPLAADAATAVLGQLDDTYIIVRRGGDLVVFDQHTAHERVLYERLEDAAGVIPRQELLLPATATLSRAAAADLRACLPALAEAGFDMAEFGADTFILRGHPADLAVGDAEGLFAQLVKDFAEAGRPAAADDRRDTVRKSVACRAAVKAGQPLAPNEMAALVGGLLRTRRPEVCPHGRPTMVHLSSRELAKLFGR